MPVVTPKNSIFSPGGAGNVAMNLSSLSVKAHCVGNVGNDNLRTGIDGDIDRIMVDPWEQVVGGVV